MEKESITEEMKIHDNPELLVRGRECDCKHYLPLKEPMPHKVGWCAYKDEPIDDQEVGNCEARERRRE